MDEVYWRNEFDKLDESQKRTLQAWIGEFLKPIFTINWNNNSDALTDTFNQSPADFVVTKDQFKGALLHMGYMVAWDGRHWNISKRSIKKMRTWHRTYRNWAG